MKNTKKTQILILILCLLMVPMFAQDLPADFGDVLDDNPDDAPIANYYWVFALLITTIVYIIKKKYNKKIA